MRRVLGDFSSLTRADLLLFVAILVFGASAVLLHPRRADFWGEDVFYADAAQSLLHHGFYGVNGNPETTQPPGLAVILAVLFSMFGYGYVVSVGAMAVFATLGFMIAYQLLRRRVPRLVAATICILLLSSPAYFAWATRMVYPCFPYFFTTMTALLFGDEYDKASTARSKLIWGTALTASVMASLLIATGTIALLGALVAVVVVTAFRDRRLARTRLHKFLLVLLLGIAVQGLWMHRKPAPLEWSLPGYPASYLQQLGVKSGNHPELGMAKLSDIPNRVITNLMAESDILSRLVLRHGINQTKVAMVIVPVLLLAIGWAYSIWKTGGMELADWYFAGYQLTYLLWPWTMGTRFLLPIAPLACFYMWQGVNGAIHASRVQPRVVGIIWFPVALVMTISGVHWIYTHGPHGTSDLLDGLLISVWLISSGCAFRMAYTGQSIFSQVPFSRIERWFKQPIGAIRLGQYAGSLVVVGLVLIGILIDIRIARENLSTTDLFSAEKTSVVESLAAEVEAGVWLRSHTPLDSVVMARHWPTVHHYAQRKLVWFAPISDPAILLNGIVKHGVGYVVVVKHVAPYYLPDDDYCFDRLLATHAGNFRLVLQKGNLRIFSVEKNVDAEPSGQRL